MAGYGKSVSLERAGSSNVHRSVLFCSVLFCSVLFCMFYFALFCSACCTVPHFTVLCCT